LIKIRKSKRPAEAGLLQTIQTFFKTLKQTILFAAAELVDSGEAEAAKCAAGNAGSVISTDDLDLTCVITYLGQVFETALAVTAAGEDANTDLSAYEERGGGVVTSADQYRDLAYGRNLLRDGATGAVRIAEGFSKERSVTSGSDTFKLV